MPFGELIGIFPSNSLSVITIGKSYLTAGLLNASLLYSLLLFFLSHIVSGLVEVVLHKEVHPLGMGLLIISNIDTEEGDTPLHLNMIIFGQAPMTTLGQVAVMRVATVEIPPGLKGRGQEEAILAAVAERDIDTPTLTPTTVSTGEETHQETPLQTGR